MVYTNRTAVFTCEVTDDAAVGWLVNGTFTSRLPEEIRDDIDIEVPVGGLVHTLTIPARVEYNLTRVQCEAQEFRGAGFEISDNATLTIQGT